ncbi:hypothetical protein [Methylobacterium sp. WL18]|uniref:hypothetical protein n=1 Tax=Methylobacterium sp. WL18 TaxID=2603897 RepID=UPI001FED6A64|nr:hypothetical protein [Methylobacterium sp. WL18]
MGHFGLRYLAAFGPGVPDGVISLDAMALERGVAEPVASRGLVTFVAGDPGRPVYRAPPPVYVEEDYGPVCHFERRRTIDPYGDVYIRRVRVCE